MTNADSVRSLDALRTMPGRLRERARRTGNEGARRRTADGSFSLLEHVWHLADLEREAFGVRIRRLRDETDPELPDFDGGAIAAERRYDLRSLDAGLDAFEQARAANLSTLAQLRDDDWSRRGHQAGVGVVSLGDLPRLMAEHDAVHSTEMDALRAEQLLESLGTAPARLAAAIAAVPGDRLRRPPLAPPADVEALSAVGHARHVGDIETEGYQIRIRRLREEIEPRLASLPGERMAIERRYDADDPDVAVQEFGVARARTLETLRGVRPAEWSRRGDFEGYGPVTLLELVEIIDAHDAGHLRAVAGLGG